jgi:tRNA modification GTPase
MRGEGGRAERDTICAVATSGVGALGIIRVSGPAALMLLRRLCRRQRFMPRHLHLATLWHPEGQLLERALVCYMPAPGTYTGEDSAEIYAHGGERNLERLLAALLVCGARQAEPGEFTRRAFMNGRLDLAQAEAVAEVIAARSDRALENAHAALQGGVGDRVRALRQRVVELAAMLEAEIDFEDELRSSASSAVRPAAFLELRDAVEAFARTYAHGRLLAGARVGLVGPVNVGKSSLLNQLLGVTRAVVSAEPGTTRDYVEAEVSWRGQRITLVDSAGSSVDGSGGELERAARALAGPVLQSCDLLLAVIDLSADQPELGLPCSDRPRLVVANKRDRAPLSAVDRLQDALNEPVVATSALRGDGIDELRELIVNRLFSDGASEESVRVSQRRHVEALEEAGRALAEGAEAQRAALGPELVVEHLRQALSALDKITGERVTEEVLDEVFSQFCIGK